MRVPLTPDGGITGGTRTLVAFNSAADHPNRVHDPDWARSVGLEGGLVPGVDVFAYLASAAVTAWGPDFLERGALEARFRRPVYDGELMTITAEPAADAALAVRALGPDGSERAAGTAQARHDDPDPAPRDWPLTGAGPLRAATPAALASLDHLGSLSARLDPDGCRRQLEEVRELNPLFTRHRLVHPGHLLRFADAILGAAVELPPWMHVSSRARLFGSLPWGASVSVRARRTGLFEKGGHRFIQLDVLVCEDAPAPRPVLRVNPYTAIYDPAWNRRGAATG